MQTSTTLRTLTKAGINVRREGNRYFGHVNGHDISWVDQEGTVHILHTKRSSEQADSRSDYSPGSYWNSLKSAMTYGLGLK